MKNLRKHSYNKQKNEKARFVAKQLETFSLNTKYAKINKIQLCKF